MNSPAQRRGRLPRPDAVELPGERAHIALVGFMGSGKTTVGRAVAQKAGYTFLDLDELIAKQAGQSISEIFRDHGEVGFRARERGALREALASTAPLVLATGGGTFADPQMHGWIQRAARTVFLKASVETLSARVIGGEAHGKRPLLVGPDPVATVRRLLAERTPAYEQSDYTISTDGCPVDDVVGEVLRVLRLVNDAPRSARHRPRPQSLELFETPAPREAPLVAAAPRDFTIRVRAAQGDYAVEIRAERGPWMAEGIAAVCKGHRCALISDTTVAPLYARPLQRELEALGKRVSVHAIQPGESSKTLGTAASLLDRLLADGLDREDAVVAVGGGVVGDLSGFVASTLLRGVNFVQVPTTTLAVVDASVGGKTGVNTGRGKNLVGTFYSPKAVLVAASCLATQERRLHAAGLVEAVKMAVTLDADFFALLQKHPAELIDGQLETLLPILRRAVRLKADIVCRDEKERGERAILNFGHTLGHAIEVGERYALPHGEAVGLGMLAELAWAENAGLAHGVSGPLCQLLRALEVPTDWRAARIDEAAMNLDKKRSGNTVHFPVVTKIGSCAVETVDAARLFDFFFAKEATP